MSEISKLYENPETGKILANSKDFKSDLRKAYEDGILSQEESENLYKKYQIEKGKIERETTKLMKEFKFGKEIGNILGKEVAEKIKKKIQDGNIDLEKLNLLDFEELKKLKDILKEHFPDEKVEKIIKEITSKTKGYLENSNEELVKETNTEGFDEKFLDVKKDKDGNEKKELSVKKIGDELRLNVRAYLKENNRQPPLTSEEKKMLMLKFITDNTANLTPQQIKNFIEIAENTAKLLIINLIQEHTKDYVQSSGNIHEFESLLTKRGVNIYETLTEKEERQKVEAEKQQEKVSDNSQQTNNSRYNLDKNGNLTFVSWSGEKVNVQLSPAEQHLIEHNPSMRRNIIRFNRVLYSSGLGKLWNFRHEIFKGIANIKGVSFDAFDENYLSRNEMKIFMNAILKSVGKQEINVDMANMRGFIGQVKDENGRNAFGKTATDFSGKSDIEKEFLEKFVSNGIFNLIAFEETLKSSPKNDEK